MEKEIYKTILGPGKAKIEEKKSIFIANARHVDSVKEADAFVKEIRESYPDARHNVYAYLCGPNGTRYSDDGEPSGTAGMPILDIIRKSGLCDTAVVVTRYFGGTLLGTGGLVRAYSLSAKLAIEDGKIGYFENYTTFSVKCSYSDYQKIKNEAEKAGAKSGNVNFADEVDAEYAIKEELFPAFADNILKITSARAEAKMTGTKRELTEDI